MVRSLRSICRLAALTTRADVGIRAGQNREIDMDQALTAWSASYRDFKPASEIFVVDDDENMRDLLEATLAPEGFPVTSFADGDAFLRAASTRLPLCVFLDVVMPKRSGLDVLKELRARQYSTPIFLM